MLFCQEREVGLFVPFFFFCPLLSFFFFSMVYTGEYLSSVLIRFLYNVAVLLHTSNFSGQ